MFHKEPKKKLLVAVARVEHLGDIVASEPIARHIRSLYPHDFIVWFVRNEYSDLLKYNPDIDAVRIVHCVGEWNLLLRSGCFDRTYNLQKTAHDCRYCRVMGRPSEKHQDVTFENYYDRGNLLTVFSYTAELEVADSTPKMYYPESICSAVDRLQLPESYCTIHTQSNVSERSWDNVKRIELIRILSTRYRLPIVNLGLVSDTLDEHIEMLIDLSGKLSILETAEVIRRSILFIGTDSGPAHIANAQGVYGIILIGKLGNFIGYMPYSGRYKNGDGCDILYSEGPTHDIETSDVCDAIDRWKLQSNSQE